MFSSGSSTAKRDIVQFVELNQFMGGSLSGWDKEQLAREVLRDQVKTDFCLVFRMWTASCLPPNLIKRAVSNLILSKKAFKFQFWPHLKKIISITDTIIITLISTARYLPSCPTRSLSTCTAMVTSPDKDWSDPGFSQSKAVFMRGVKESHQAKGLIPVNFSTRAHHLRQSDLNTRVYHKMKNPFLWAGLQNPIVSMYEEPKYQFSEFLDTYWPLAQ